MTGTSAIEWTDATWNPIAGCTIVSPGCTHCYAMRHAARIERMIPSLEHYKGLTKPSKPGPVWTGKVALAPERTLLEPLRRRKPTMYFVNSMSDLFHEDVPDEWVDRIFAVMALCPQHQFQVLTKRSARMREYVADERRFQNPGYDTFASTRGLIEDQMFKMAGDGQVPAWPLPNVWLGISAERQQEADERIPHLIATPAAVRFVSAEPLLGAIDLTYLQPGGDKRINALTGYWWGPNSADNDPPSDRGAVLDWLIVGGESGREARPMHPDWARSIRDQCTAAGVAFFFKQWGEWAPSAPAPITGATGMVRVGKKAAGRLLDGRAWNEMPTPGKAKAPAPECAS